MADGSQTRLQRFVSVLGLVLWLAAVIYISQHHEMWRDEVRALSIALEANFFWQLPQVLRNEGHPVVWYGLLRMGYALSQTPVILKIVSIGVVLGALFLFLWKAPFAQWQKGLFLISVFPLYEYPVHTRNYGISMLLMFGFATLYPHRHKYPWRLAGVLVLLANTNVHSCGLVGVLLLLWGWNEWTDRKIRNQSTESSPETEPLPFYHWVGAAILVLLGMGAAALTTWPDSDTVVTKALVLTPSQIGGALWNMVLHPGVHFAAVLPSFAPWQRDLWVGVLISGLLIRPPFALGLWLGTLALGMVFQLVYQPGLRHQGLWFVFVLTLYWIVAHQLLKMRLSPSSRGWLYKISFQGHGKRGVWFTRVHQTMIYGGITIILLAQVFVAQHYVTKDLDHALSSSQAFAEFLQSHPDYREAILIGEPDYLLEAMPYYTENRLYLAREEQFRQRIQFTQDSRPVITLKELMEAARHIKATEGKPVLLVLGHYEVIGQSIEMVPKIEPGQDPVFKFNYSYNREFHWTISGLTDLLTAAEKVAEFKGAQNDENYVVYGLK